jgi:hypothetical protein
LVTTPPLPINLALPVADTPSKTFIARWQNSGAAERANYAL